MLSSSTIGPFPQLEGSFVQVPNTVSANAIALAHNKDWANAVEILQEAELSPTNVDSLFLKQAVQGIALLNLCQYHLASHAFDRRGNDPVLVAGDPANVRRLAALLTALHTLAETLRAGVLTSVDATVAKVTNELLSFADIADSRVLGSAVERAAAIDALADVATHARVAGILTLARGASSLSLSTVATELGWPASADVTDFVTSLGGSISGAFVIFSPEKTAALRTQLRPRSVVAADAAVLSNAGVGALGQIVAQLTAPVDAVAKLRLDQERISRIRADVVGARSSQ